MIGSKLQKLNKAIGLFRSPRTYSYNEIIHEYCGYPRWLSLPGIQHGWFLSKKPWHRDLSKKYISIYLAWSVRMQKAWANESKKPAFVLGAPFVHYRRLKNLEKASDAMGTIVFPAHSTPNNSSVYDINSYCAKLNSLPEKFKPLTICLHYYDMITETKKTYIQNGFKVVCAGNPKENVFVEHFYSLLRTHKYATSNKIGSYVLYSVELGIPFFLFGNDVKVSYIRKKDENTQSSKDSIRRFAEDMFSISSTTLNQNNLEITADQESFVFNEAGINDCLKPNELRRVLLRYYFLRTIPMSIYKLLALPYRIVKWIARAVRNKMVSSDLS